MPIVFVLRCLHCSMIYFVIVSWGCEFLSLIVRKRFLRIMVVRENTLVRFYFYFHCRNPQLLQMVREISHHKSYLFLFQIKPNLCCNANHINVQQYLCSIFCRPYVNVNTKGRTATEKHLF